MFEVGIVVGFEAAHRLQGDFGPATRRHGHSYRVEVTARGQKLRPDGTLCDIALLRSAVGEAIGELDYQDLDEIPALTGANTTAENVAKHLFDRIAKAIPDENLSSLRISVWESHEAFAVYEGLLGPPPAPPAPGNS